MIVILTTPTHIFHEKIQEIEKQFVEHYATMNQIYGRSKKSAVIYAYLMIHKVLSIKALISLTGYSERTIYNKISLLLKKNAIERKRGKGANGVLFNIATSALQSVVTNPERDSLNSDYMKYFFQKYSALGEKLQTSTETAHFLKRLKDMKFFYEFYHNKWYLEDKKWNFAKINDNPIHIPTNFSTAFIDVEQNFINELLKIDYLQEDDEKVAKILLFFITRETLSVSVFEKLTGYSRNTIIDRLKILSDSDCIEYIPSTKYYIMYSMTQFMAKSEVHLLSVLKKFSHFLQETIEEIGSASSEYNLYYGQAQIYLAFTQFLNMLKTEIKTLQEDPLVKYYL